MESSRINVVHHPNADEQIIYNPPQHYQQHISTHTAAVNEPLIKRYSGEHSHSPQPAVHFVQSGQVANNNTISVGGNANIIEKSEKKHAKTTTTTTTTSTTPVLVASAVLNENEKVNTILSNVNDQGDAVITVEHYESSSDVNWSNLDTYLHIFLTFYFGHFAAMLFFDGVVRNVANLFVFEHTAFSPLIFIVHILFSILFLAFTVWFMTVCWRWWRNKSLTPENTLTYYDIRTQKNMSIKQRQKQARVYVCTAAILLIAGFFIFLIIGILDLSFKKQQRFVYENVSGGKTGFGTYYGSCAYTADLAVFIFRLIFWLIGIVAILMLSRDGIMSICCPSKQIKIDREKPTTVYEVTRS